MPNNNAFNEVFLSFQRQLARAISRIVPPKEIEDIVQETYVRVCQIENPETIRHPRSFLLTTARNLAFDHLKRSESKYTQSLDLDNDLEFEQLNQQYQDETYQSVAGREDFALFCEAVRLLPVQCRKVFVLRKVYGYSQREIATELNLSESTVEKHIALGMKRCLHFMKRHSLKNIPNSKDINTPVVRVIS